MKHARAMLFAAALATLPMAVCAMDGQLMKEFLESKNPSDKTYLKGYIQGIDSALGVSSARLSTGCGTVVIGEDQRLAVLDKYLRENPEKWHYEATAILEDAFAKAFPCKAYRDRNQRFQDELERTELLRAADQTLKACEARIDAAEQKCTPSGRRHISAK